MIDSRFNSLAWLYYLLALLLAFSFFYLETGGLVVLCLHDLTEDAAGADPLAVEMARVQQKLAELKRAGYRFLDPGNLREYLYGLPGSPDPGGKKIFLVLDDGLLSQGEKNLDLFGVMKIPVAVAVIENRVGTRGYLDAGTIEKISRRPGVTLFHHSRDHQALDTQAPASAAWSLTPTPRASQWLDPRFPALVLPYGIRPGGVEGHLRDRFLAVFSLDLAFTTPLTNPLDIPRILVTRDNLASLSKDLAYHDPFPDVERLMKVLILLLTFVCGRFAFLARDLDPRDPCANLPRDGGR